MLYVEVAFVSPRWTSLVGCDKVIEIGIYDGGSSFAIPEVAEGELTALSRLWHHGDLSLTVHAPAIMLMQFQ